MLRPLLLMLAAVSTAPLAISECELRSVWRGSSVQHYVPKAIACLENPRSGVWFDAAVELKVLDLINQERAERGLPTLQWRDELLAAARIHSFDMAQEGFFDHQGPDFC